MRNVKSYVAAGIVAVMAATSLAGCATTTQAATTAAETTTTAENKADPAKDKKEPEDQLLTLVNDGKLSQTTYDAIQNYWKENQPEKPTGEDDKKTPENGQMKEGETPPAKPEGDAKSDNGKEPPEKPSGEGNADREGKGPMGMMINKETLDKLLSSNIITQAEYDVIKEVIPEMPEKPTEAK